VKQFITGAEQESQAVAAGFKAAQHRPLVGGQMGVLLLIR
jgi:demethylmenaquinone methyltransferase/2-methoxy-6-polyprenyl-1,4-benzoquinol methylase